MATMIVVTHLGGLPNLKESGMFRLIADTDRLVVQTSGFKATELASWPWSEVGVTIGTEQEVKERLTLSRLALVGPFAVFFKKKKSTVDYYVTISTSTDSGLFQVHSISQKSLRPFRTIVENAKRNNQNESFKEVGQSNLKESGVIDPLERLEKLANLLERGALTQEEFDQKKREILSL